MDGDCEAAWVSVCPFVRCDSSGLTSSLRKIVHSEDIEHTLRNLDEEAWPKLVAQAGLTIVEVKEVKTLGLYYYLGKA